MMFCRRCALVVAASLVCLRALADTTIIDKDDYGPCGQVSLYCAAHRAGIPITWEQVVKELGPPSEGRQHSFADIASAASRLGLYPLAIEIEPQLWETLPVPVIAHMRYPSRGRKEPHFVTVLDASSRGIWVLDPPFSAMEVKRTSFEEASTNRFLILSTSEQESQRIRDFYGSRLESQALLALVILNALFALGFLGSVGRPALSRALSHGLDRSGHFVRSCTKAARWQFVCAGIGLVVAILGAAFFGPHGIRSQTPRLAISRDNIDLGVIMPGTQSVDVLLKNDGGKTLHFDKPRTSCNCTHPELPDSLAPGAEGLLKLTVITSPGQGGSDVVVPSNDPRGPMRIRLNWIGMTKPILSPSRVICQAAPLSTDYEQRIDLLCTRGDGEDTSPEIALFRSSPEVDITLIEGRPDVTDDAPGANSAQSDFMWGVESASFMRKQLLVRVTAPPGPALVSPRCWLEIKYKTFTEKIDVPVAVRFVHDVVPRFDEILISDPSFSALKGMKRVVPLDASDRDVDVQIDQSPGWLKSSLVRSPSGELSLDIEVSEEISAACDGNVVLRTSKGEVPIAVRLFALQ